MRGWRMVSWVVGAAAIVAALPASAAAVTQVAPATDPGPVSARDGLVAWPERDASGAWAIHAASGSTVMQPPLGSFARMPHVSVGVGRPALLYERCARACRVFQYDIERRRTRRVLSRPPEGVPCRRLSSAARSGRAIVFRATRCSGKRGSRLYHRAPSGRLSRLPALAPQPGISFASGAVAYVDTHRSLPGHRSQGNIVVVRPGKAGRRVLDSGSLAGGFSKTPMVVYGETEIRVSSPVIDGGLVHWLRSATSHKGDDYEVATARLGGGRQCASRRMSVERGAPQSIAVDAGRLYYTTPQGVFEDTELRFSWNECG